MKETKRILVGLCILVALLIEGGDSIKVDKLFLSYEETVNSAFNNANGQITLNCNGGTYDINSYSTPNLYVQVSDIGAFRSKKGYINNDENMNFESLDSSDRGKRSLSKTYNPVTSATFIEQIYIPFYGYSEKDRKTCNINISNTWKCGPLIGEMCTVEVLDKDKLYATKNGDSVTVTYVINPKFDSSKPECGCKSWGATVDDKSSTLNCNQYIYDNTQITQKVSLEPNTANKKEYKFSATLTTTHEITKDIYEKIDCGEVTFTIKNPPTSPNLGSPSNNAEFYYSWSNEYYNPTFTWEEPDNWGYLGEGVTITPSYYIEVYNEAGTAIVSKRTSDKSISNIYRFTEGNYKWKVFAAPDMINVTSDPQSFSVCEIGKIGGVTNTAPVDGAYVGKNVKLSWSKPDKGSSCALDSFYTYSITIKKDNKLFKEHDNINFDELNLQLNDLPDGTYQWEIKTIGPENVVSDPASSTFVVCTKSAPGSPSSPYLEENSAIICTDNTTDQALNFNWGEATEKGKACEYSSKGFNYILSVYNLEADKYTNYTTNSLKYSTSVPCNTSKYKALVYANNGFTDSKPVEYQFSVCYRYKPGKPAVANVDKVNYCSKNTIITWTHSDWGSQCDDTGKKTFTVLYGNKKVEKDPSYFSTTEDNSYSYTVELEEGVWDVSVIACTLNGKLCSEAGTAKVNAATIPNIIVYDVFNNATSITFSWGTNSSFLWCESFIYTLTYTINGVETVVSDIPVKELINYTIDIEYETIYWYLTLSNAKGEKIYTEEESYNANNKCEIKEPKWPDNPLISPIDDKVIFGSVTFEWNKVSSFGTACKKVEASTETDNYIKDDGADKLYMVSVSGNTFNTTSSSILITEESLTYGTIDWTVTAYNGNVSATTIGEKFCHANYPPGIDLICPEGPYLGTELNWTTDGFKVTCNRKHGYTVKYGTENFETSETFFEVNETYFGRNITWSVYSYVDNELSEVKSCTTYLCVIKSPKKVEVEGHTDHKNKYGEWTFNWTNTNDYDNMCGLNVSFSYEVIVFFKDAIINSFYTNETSIDFKFDESGDYTLSVSVNDSISISEPNNATLNLCIPEPFEKPTLTSPGSGVTILSDKVEMSKFEYIINYTDTQCGNSVNYTLYYWRNEEQPKEIDITNNKFDYNMKELEQNSIYYWNIRITSEYYNVTSETRNFSVCTPSTPTVPVLDPYIRINEQDYTITWSESDFGNLCDLKDSTSYNVYFFKNGDGYESVRSVSVNSASYTLKDLTDGEYQIVVEAVNYEYTSQPSKPMNVSVCIPSDPGKPSLWYPKPGSVLPITDGISFDVVPQLNKGSQCGTYLSENNGESSMTSFGLYQLYVNGAKVAELYENEINSIESFSKQVYRFPTITNLNYETNSWKVTYTNDDGLTTESDAIVFYGCKKPLAPRNTYPYDNETFERFELNLTWEIDQDDFGHKCTTDEINPEEIVRVYMDVVNTTEVMTDQNVTDPNKINFSILTPTTIVASTSYLESKKFMVKNAQVGAMYIWRTETFNGFDVASSETRMFKITADYCQVVSCGEHGNCSNELRMCICEDGYMGDLCDVLTPKNKGNSVLGPALGGSLGGIVLIAIIIALILFIFMRKSGRKRVVLEGPGGDIRFSRVKVPKAGREAPDEETAAIEQRIREDCERLQSGMSSDEAFVFAKEFRTKIKSESIEDGVKAVLYTYYKFGCGRELLKLFISGEVNKAQKPETLFRQNSPASTMFKHWSKIIGLDYLFACFSDILKGLIQHEVDAANDRKSDVSLQLFNDTCEVDPTKITDDEDVEQLLAVNAIQLSLTVQRFATQIYRSVTKIPYEIKDICIHIYTTIEAAYPGHGVRGVSAFLFLRFYSVSISVPEVYGLLKSPPSDELRRTLVLVSKVLQVMSLGNKFGDKEEFMKQFNTLVDENKDRIDAFYKGVLDKNKQCEEIKPDVKVPPGVYRDSLLFMNHAMNSGKKNPAAATTSSTPDSSQAAGTPTPV